MSRLTGNQIAEIAKLLDESHFTSLDLKLGDFKLKIRRDGGSYAAEDFEEEAPLLAPTAEPAAAPASIASAAAGEVDVPAPLLGNYYAAPRPGEPPFVAVGDAVTPDTTIAIIEVMKLMNPIRAGVSGTVTALLVQNGTAVEEGQPLIRVKVDG